MGRDRNLNYEPAFGQLAAARCILSLLFQVRTGHYQDQVAPVAYFQPDTRPHNHVCHCPISCQAPGPRAINNVRSLYFCTGQDSFRPSKRNLGMLEPCRYKCAVPMGWGKKHIGNRSVGRPVSLGWANRTLGESWSVALVVVGKLRGQNIHD